MVRTNLVTKSSFAMIGTLMLIVGLMFLFYMGNTLVGTTRRYQVVQTCNESSCFIFQKQEPI